MPTAALAVNNPSFRDCCCKETNDEQKRSPRNWGKSPFVPSLTHKVLLCLLSLQKKPSFFCNLKIMLYLCTR